MGSDPPTDKAHLLNPTRVQRHLEHEPDWNEKPFSPADGGTIAVNPPAFVWLPVKKYGGGYLLAISRNADFSTGELSTGESSAGGGQNSIIHAPVNVHIPTEPMPAGRWFWRVGVRLSDEQIVWGKTRRFIVPDSARIWPFPKMDELLAKIPQSHPRLFFSRKNLEQVRSQCQTTLSREYAKLLATAEGCIGKKLVAEPDFLKQQGTARGAEYAAIIRATRPSMDGMEACAMAYLLSGERRFGDEAKRRLLHFFSWDPNGSTSLFHNDEPAMWMMQRGVRAYDWTHDLFSPEERKKIEAVMKVRCGQFRQRLRRMPFESRPYSSHPARDLGFLGEAALCFAHDWPEAPGWLAYVMKVYWSVFPAWGEEDGGWQEGPSYWQAYMGFALHFTTALEKATGEKISSRPFFQNTPYYKLYTNPPYARMSPFGDAQTKPPGRGAGRVMYCFSTLLWDPYVRWYADVVRSGPGTMPMSFVLADRTLETRPPVDLPGARVFPGAGLVAMHDDLADTVGNAFLVMRSSPMGSVSHGHSDQNAFAIEAHGEALAIASGYYPWYGSPHHHYWTRSTKAKNCITFDGGQGQTRRSAKSRGRIARFITGRRLDYAMGDATEAYGGRLTRVWRHVIHIRPATFVIIDELAAPEPVSFEWNLHALEKMEIDAEKQQVKIRRNNAALLAGFVQPQKLAFSQTGQFTPPPENGRPNQWHLAAATQKTKSAAFIVVLQTHPAGRTPPPIKRLSFDGCHGVAWTDGRVEHKILYGPGGIKTPRIDTDARIVALTTRQPDAEETIGWLVVDATRISIDDRQRFLVEPPSTDKNTAVRVTAARVTAACSADEDGIRLTTDAPAADIRLAADKPPLQIRRGREKLPLDAGNGTVTLRLPAGRHATDIHYSPVIDKPVLTVKVSPNDERDKQIVGRMFNRVEAVWRYRFDGLDGRYRLSRPPGLRIVQGVEPVHGDTISLRHGQVLWLSGRASRKPLELTRLP
jgi:hypothetical protein